MVRKGFGFIPWTLPIFLPLGGLDYFLDFPITSLTFQCFRKLLVMSGNLGEKPLADWFLPPFLAKLLFLMFQVARTRSAISFWSDIVFGVSVR